MSIFRNQAERVFKHCKAVIVDQVIMDQHNLTIQRFEKDIEEIVSKTGQNGKMAADTMIKMVDQIKGQN